MGEYISGFSKLSKTEKIEWLRRYTHSTPDFSVLDASGEKEQKIIEGLSENVIGRYALPYSIVPNFLINGRYYNVPMVTEESSVVAAAAAAAKFWAQRGGIKTEVLGNTKLGQIHFTWSGPRQVLETMWDELVQLFMEVTEELTANMRARGGGIKDISLKSFEDIAPEYYQILVGFDTKDSMGANFINSVLERIGEVFEDFIGSDPRLADWDLEVIMCILSNYAPDCRVRASVTCSLTEQQLPGCGQDDSMAFAKKFEKAIRIAEMDVYRATTHNKGIFNGVDAVVIATGNDFRAVEACGHAYAARDGQYRSLSRCRVTEDRFHFWLEIPLTVGTVGGLTKLHPLAKFSLELLGHPTAEELMQIIAAVGLMQNFAAVRSLVTTGIQHGHMKMHLTNIVNHLEASPQETERILDHFKDKKVSFTAVRNYLEQLRREKV